VNLWSILLSVVLVASPSFHAEAASRVLKDIEIYGSEKVTTEDAAKALGGKIRAYMGADSSRGKRSKKRATTLKGTVEDELKKMGGFGWVRLRLIDLSRKDGKIGVLALFDVIEKEHMATRFPFRDVSDKDVKDPGGLLADWKNLTSTAKERVHSGTTKVERGECSAFYCPEGAGGERIVALDKKIDATVRSYREALMQVLRLDKDSRDRAAAVYLLSYLDEGSAVTAMVREALKDPSRRVRDAALDVFNDIALYHKDVPLPIHEISRLMDYPHPDDRTRALALLLSIADNKDYESFMVGTAAPQIVKLLRQKNPTTQEMAHTVLTFLSGESFPAQDYDAWEDWLWKQRRKISEEKD